MDTISGSGIVGMKRQQHRICRVAYTLNNDQPVRCTIIGEQPLFYMDFEEDMETDTPFLDSHDIATLEREINDLKDKIEDFDDIGGFDISLETKFNDLFTNAMDIMEPAHKAPAHDIALLLTEARKSRLAAAYLENAAQYGITIHYNDAIEHAAYDRAGACIFINPAHSMEEQILLLARELRRQWQHRQGALVHPLMFHPDNAILIHRAQIADLTASMVRIAWELQLNGHKGVWLRLENSSMADLARAFSREAYLDFRTINNGIAMAAVFEAWFLSERCRGQDRGLIQQMLADYQGYVFDIDQSLQGLTPMILSALGAMPFGKNYLAAHAVTIMNDPIFTDVRDRSNANFLWFIKFERSFRETEQELQTSEGSTGRKSSKGSKSQNPQGLSDAEQPAQIIQLYDGPAPAGTEDSHRLLKPRRKKSKSAEIIYLQQRGSAE